MHKIQVIVCAAKLTWASTATQQQPNVILGYQSLVIPISIEVNDRVEDIFQGKSCVTIYDGHLFLKQHASYSLHCLEAQQGEIDEEYC